MEKCQKSVEMSKKSQISGLRLQVGHACYLYVYEQSINIYLLDVCFSLRGHAYRKSSKNVIVLKMVNVHSRYEKNENRTQILVFDVQKLMEMKNEKQKKHNAMNNL